MRTIEQMVHQEVLCCMSSLVSTLAKCSGVRLDCDQGRGMADAIKEGSSLISQAYELTAPVEDWKEAAIQAGWKEHAEFGPDNGIFRKGPENVTHHAESWEQACALDGIDPYSCEVFEHWAVSLRLAEKLTAQGERVDTDFAGLNIWVRTTTGQAISMDGVIQRIYKGMMK